MFLKSDYNYKLPKELIAQHPLSNRDESRLFHINRQSKKFTHYKFSDILDLIDSNDVLVVNNTKVIPARLFGKKETGGKVEILILDYESGIKDLTQTGSFVSQCLIKCSKAPKIGSSLFFSKDFFATVLNYEDGMCLLKFVCEGNFDEKLEKTGKIPLPPYINRHGNELENIDKISYQTVYASNKGAVAAPTAGLHFTKPLLEKIKNKNIDIFEITLHVGYGTFVPVRVKDIRNHKIHSEFFNISQNTADKLNEAKTYGKRIIAVGTTSVRTLEYATNEKQFLTAKNGFCDLFIYPGYKFKFVDAIITNFHLPESTLLMLISAFADKDLIFKAYDEAVDKKYRFFSYGDSMFID